MFLPMNQVSFAGGCFLVFGKSMMVTWRNYFSNIFQHYINNKQFIKDDQIIIAHCILTDILNNNGSLFEIHTQPDNLHFDPWFYFTSILLSIS
jgi:hypothetical protein